MKCFDALWLKQCCNYLYEYGVKDDKLAMIYEGNKLNKVVVRSPAGLTEMFEVEECVAQGSGLGPTLCAVSVDNIGRDALARKEHVYMYKGSVEIPPLGMIDDVAHVQECGIKSVEDNAYIVARFEQDKLELNRDKCRQIHVGKNQSQCSTLRAHEDKIKIVLEEKYLGDIVTSNGKHTSNIKRRSSKCIGLIVDIVNLLNLLCLGKHYFKTAVLLRQAMLLSVMLTNSETWLRLTKKDMERLESVDRMFLRKILQAPSKTPIPALYLELGCIPVKFIIKMKRIMFLHHILKLKPDEMISKVLWAQIYKPVKNDWSNVVEEDLQAVGLGHMNVEDIQNKTKNQMKRIVKKAIAESAFKNLMEEKTRLKKMENIQYEELDMQKYLSSENIINRHKKLAFKIRTRMTDLKNNFGKKEKCEICEKPNSEDAQSHAFLDCDVIKVLCLEIRTNVHSKYADFFSGSEEKIQNVVKLCNISLQKRQELLEKD